MNTTIFATQLANNVSWKMLQLLQLPNEIKKADVLLHYEASAQSVSTFFYSYVDSFNAQLGYLLEQYSPQHLSLLQTHRNEEAERVSSLKKMIKTGTPVDEVAQHYFLYLAHVSKATSLMRNIVVQWGKIIPLHDQIKAISKHLLLSSANLPN